MHISARLGLGFNLGLGGRGFWRCMSTSTETKSRGRSVYLCFTESNFCGLEEYTSQVIRPIRIQSDTLSGKEEESLLREAVYKTTRGNLKHFPYAKYRSNIIFPYGSGNHATHICRLDTSTYPLKFDSQKTIDDNGLKLTFNSHEHPKGEYLACFRESRHDVVLGEVQGILYCFNNDNRFRYDPYFPNFESFNPGTPFLWLRVNKPPFLRGKHTPNYGLAFLNAARRILGWELGKPGVFAFNVDGASSDGWTKVPLPLENHRKPFIVHGCNRDLGDFHVLFTYDPDTHPLSVSAFFISKNFDQFHPLTDNPIELPELSSHYLLSPDVDEVEWDEKHMAPTVSSDFQFVDIGRNRVGLVLHKYFEDDPNQGRNTGKILLLAFEFDIISGFNNTLQIKTNFPEPHRFRYCTEQLHRESYNTETCCEYHKDSFDKKDGKDVYTETRQVHLDAAFLI